jgi:hypothetical protein
LIIRIIEILMAQKPRIFDVSARAMNYKLVEGAAEA